MMQGSLHRVKLKSLPNEDRDNLEEIDMSKRPGFYCQEHRGAFVFRNRPSNIKRLSCREAP